MVQLETPLDAAALPQSRVELGKLTSLIRPQLELPAELFRHVSVITPNETEAASLLSK